MFITRIRTLFTCILALLGLPLSGMAQEKMVVHMKDGSIIEYDMSAVDFVELQTAAPESGRPQAEGVGGTVGEGIDLGLSVKWADQNIGASLPQEAGKPLAWSEAASTASSVWGDGWRVPTEWEWQELYDKCVWQWTVNSGVPGRLITGPNGNSIFMPAAGVTVEGENVLHGICGIYWTAGIDDSQSNSAMGFYFDSASIYRMGYPSANGSYVRPVRQ